MITLYRRVKDAVAWRLWCARRKRYLRQTFINGEELAQSWIKRSACDQAVLRDGTVIRHPPGRLGLAQMILEVWFEQVYTGSFYQPRDGDVVIDAGANIGMFSFHLARACPACRVLAFEPFDENFQLLKSNLAGTAVQAFALALSGEAGTAALRQGVKRSQDHQLVAADSGAAAGAATVQTASFADVLELAEADDIALFKCDIEGSELELFRSARDEDLARVRRFAVEYHDVIRDGCLATMQQRLARTHDMTVKPEAPGARFGMFYATRK